MEKKKKDGVAVTIWMDAHMVTELERIANKAGITRSKLVSNMMEVALGEIKLYEKTGILYSAMFLRDVQENVRRFLAGQKKEAVST